MNSNKNEGELEQLKLNIATYKFREEIQKSSALKNKQKKGVNLTKRKIIATACASLILVSGIAFAINSKKVTTTDRGLGKGVETAIENGYIANPEMDFMDFDNKGTKIKIENFFMDDLNLSINFLIKLDRSKNNIDKISNIFLDKLVIRDEENRIVFRGNNPEFFEKYCLENNLNDNYISCGINWFIESEDKDMLRLTYNIYSDGFPKSKKLYFALGGMQIQKFKNGTENNYEIQGNWNVEIDIPENMYNRAHEEYKVISCSNNDFNIYKAMATDVGFELGVIMPTKNENVSIIKPFSSYVKNENGEKFYSTLNVSNKYKRYYLEGDKYDFYDTFDMTKYNATNKIEIVLYYYGKPVIIELEKIN